MEHVNYLHNIWVFVGILYSVGVVGVGAILNMGD